MLLSASNADPNGVIPFLHPDNGNLMSIVAHRVKIKGKSGNINNLYIDFVGSKYKKEGSFITNSNLAKFLTPKLYEVVLEKDPGKRLFIKKI